MAGQPSIPTLVPASTLLFHVYLPRCPIRAIHSWLTSPEKLLLTKVLYPLAAQQGKQENPPAANWARLSTGVDGNATSPGHSPGSHADPHILLLPWDPATVHSRGAIVQRMGPGNPGSALAQSGLCVTSDKSPQPGPAMKPQTSPSNLADWNRAAFPIIMCLIKRHNEIEHSGTISISVYGWFWLVGSEPCQKRPIISQGQFHLNGLQARSVFQSQDYQLLPSQPDTCY